MHYAVYIRIYRASTRPSLCVYISGCEKALSPIFSIIIAHVDVEIYEHGGWETTNNKMALGGGQVRLRSRTPRFHATCGSRPGPRLPSSAPQPPSPLPINILTGIAWNFSSIEVIRFYPRPFIAARILITVWYTLLRFLRNFGSLVKYSYHSLLVWRYQIKCNYRFKARTVHGLTLKCWLRPLRIEYRPLLVLVMLRSDTFRPFSARFRLNWKIVKKQRY